jgi:hypothetical protein
MGTRRWIGILVALVVLAGAGFAVYLAQPTQDERLAACYDRLVTERPDLDGVDRVSECIEITGYDARQ